MLLLMNRKGCDSQSKSNRVHDSKLHFEVVYGGERQCHIAFRVTLDEGRGECSLVTNFNLKFDFAKIFPGPAPSPSLP
jgi:hypothetical protein